MGKLTNRQIWERGVPLSKAWFDFAAESAKRQHERYKKNISHDEISNNRDFSDIKQNLQYLNEITGNLMQISNIESQMKNTLIHDLQNKKLLAFGFRAFPTHSRKPVHVEADKFENANVNWAKGQMTSRGITYADLRVIDPTQTPNWRMSRPGPKGSGGAIRKAISALQNEGFDLSSVSRKVACDKIRNRIGTDYPKGSGLSDENLSKYILAVCPKRGIDS